MARLMNELIAKRIVHFYEINGGRENSQSNKLTIKHFSEEGIRYQTIARIIKRYNARGSIDYMKIPGRPPFRSVDKVKKLYERKPETSVRIGSLKTNMPISTFQYIKKKKLKINAFVQQTVPKYTNDQIPRARKVIKPDEDLIQFTTYCLIQYLLGKYRFRSKFFTFNLFMMAKKYVLFL